jgi:hypothetical protein
MAHRRNHVEVSMFPFLSVLCAVIGVLVLFIVLVLSTRVVQQDELVRKVEEHQRKRVPGERDAVEQGIDNASYQELQTQLQRSREELRQRQVERGRLQRKLAALEDLLAFKMTQQLVPSKIERGNELCKPEKVLVVETEGMLPSDNYQVKLRPILVECAFDGYTTYPSREKFPVIHRVGELVSDVKFEIAPKLKRFLANADKRKKREYLVFLVRPNGVEAFENFRIYMMVEHKDVRVGWEPFSQEWIVINDQLQTLLEQQQGTD